MASWRCFQNLGRAVPTRLIARRGTQLGLASSRHCTGSAAYAKLDLGESESRSRSDPAGVAARAELRPPYVIPPTFRIAASEALSLAVTVALPR